MSKPISHCGIKRACARPVTKPFRQTVTTSPIKALFALCMIVFCAALSSQPVAAEEKRIALVVGISEYKTVPSLANTINDSVLISNTLKGLDFDVTTLSNVGLAELRKAIDEFSFRAEVADVALVYFAGHGVEFGGQNLLMPADITAESRSQLASQSITLDEILAAVDKARQLRIVILDSCRDDPFASEDENGLVVVNVESNRAIATGLAKPSPERGTLVAFAAEAGHVAFDGSGNNSPFALALSNNLSAENLEIGLAFRRVRDDVLRATDGSQEPHTYGSISGNPYFLAGQSTQINVLADKIGRRNAWGVLRPDQEQQLAALANTGDTRAIKGLAYMRLDPNESRYDPTQAAKLLSDAAQQQDPEALFELARLYEQGVGVDQNIQQALLLYEQSAGLNFPDAINDLGFLHFQGGLGIIRDPKKAIGYFQRAADLRHPEAMFNLAALIDDGDVAGKSPQDAAQYLYEALRSGNADVLSQLSENPKMFKPVTRRALQGLLAEKEFYTGALDADFGPQTVRGLRRAYGLEE